MKNSVTSELRKSITKVTGKILQAWVYSDSRLNKQAVGVKICYNQYPQPIIDKIVADMESKGYKLAYVKYNQPNKNAKYYQGHTVPGQRFCFYKKC